VTGSERIDDGVTKEKQTTPQRTRRMYFYTKERAMYLSPDGLADIARQHRDELIADAERWNLARAARRARRRGAARRSPGDHEAGAAHASGVRVHAGAAAGADHLTGPAAVGGAGRQGGADTSTGRWAQLDRDESRLTREALFAGRTAAIAAIAALSVQPRNLVPCGARGVERAR
jgi:hypothetical protein